MIFYQEFRDSVENQQMLLKKNNEIPKELPAIITPEGLSTDRQVYLFKEIREFCKPEVKDLVCPEPI